MVIGGFQKVSLIDYPGKLSAVIYTQGCNFRCPYCHNPSLVDPELFEDPMPKGTVLSFLATRVGKLDGVVVSGGEPTIHDDLPAFLKAIKGIGLLVKLDTNGSNPRLLEALIEERAVDYLAMDLKAPPVQYQSIVQVSVDHQTIEKSIELIMRSQVVYEFRTTFIEPLLSRNQILDIGRRIQGATRYVLQRASPARCLDPALRKIPASSLGNLKQISAELKNENIRCFVLEQSSLQPP